MWFLTHSVLSPSMAARWAVFIALGATLAWVGSALRRERYVARESARFLTSIVDAKPGAGSRFMFALSAAVERDEQRPTP